MLVFRTRHWRGNTLIITSNTTLQKKHDKVVSIAVYIRIVKNFIFNYVDVGTYIV